MNYFHIIQKYFPEAKVVIHDRTWEGISWFGPGEKPSKELFDSLKKEEERQQRVAGLKANYEADLLKERQHQARVQAEYDAVPLMDKIKAQEEEIREEILSLKLEACELQERAKTKEVLEDAWHEVSAVQAMVNAECEKYLKDTDWYVTRELETQIAIPEDVKEKRKQARDRINKGNLVYANYKVLREKEMPSREDIIKSIRAGKDELDRMREIVTGVKLRYAKPNSNRR